MKLLLQLATIQKLRGFHFVHAALQVERSGLVDGSGGRLHHVNWDWHAAALQANNGLYSVQAPVTLGP
jgi:hypothetical protein